ncbi:MAG TPA: TetR/AcrR family transcriptional regulator [Candidatus Acidoferrales bacterium]|nr:TetR/AcrR family transcriptional regulator [Candidatus Acidoferrales bacterium]
MVKKTASSRKKKTLEPQQERSRESLQKLLRAATEVLGQHGMEGATIPRIAQHAGLTPGSVYRRFHDKEALLETAILGVLERQHTNLQALTPEMVREIPLRVFADQIINGFVVGYRARAPLIRAMRQFAISRAGTPFRKKADRMERHTYERLIDLFMTHSDRIEHPQPRLAVSLGLMTAVSTVYELVVTHEDLSGWKELLPPDDQALKRELVRGFLNYLGVKDQTGSADKIEAEQLAAMKRWRERNPQNV